MTYKPRPRDGPQDGPTCNSLWSDEFSVSGFCQNTVILHDNLASYDGTGHLALQFLAPQGIQLRFGVDREVLIHLPGPVQVADGDIRVGAFPQTSRSLAP